MDPNVVPLYYLSSLVGLVMVAGAIWWIHREKIYIDSLRACRAAGIAQRSAADSDCPKTAPGPTCGAFDHGLARILLTLD